MKRILLPIVLAASVQHNISSMAKIKMMSANMSTPQKVALAAGTSAVVFGVCHYVPKLIKKYQDAAERKAKAQAAALQMQQKEQKKKQLQDAITCLMGGIYNNKLEQVKIACNQGATLSCILHSPLKSNRFSPLMVAAHDGYKEIVEELLHQGADCLQQIDGKRAIDYAKEQGHSEVEKLLKDAATTKLWNAVFRGSEGTASDAIAAGADLEFSDETDNTPLLWAVKGHDGDMIRILILAGANTQAEDNCLHTIYDFCESGDDVDTVIRQALQERVKQSVSNDYENELKSANDAQNAHVDQTEDDAASSDSDSNSGSDSDGDIEDNLYDPEEA